MCLQLLLYTSMMKLNAYLSYVPSILALLVMGKLFFQYDIQASVWCDYLIGIWTQYLMFDAKESIELNKIYKINAIFNYSNSNTIQRWLPSSDGFIFHVLWIWFAVKMVCFAWKIGNLRYLLSKNDCKVVLILNFTHCISIFWCGYHHLKLWLHYNVYLDKLIR